MAVDRVKTFRMLYFQLRVGLVTQACTEPINRRFPPPEAMKNVLINSATQALTVSKLGRSNGEVLARRLASTCLYDATGLLPNGFPLQRQLGG